MHGPFIFLSILFLVLCAACACAAALRCSLCAEHTEQCSLLLAACLHADMLHHSLCAGAPAARSSSEGEGEEGHQLGLLLLRGLAEYVLLQPICDVGADVVEVLVALDSLDIGLVQLVV